MSRWKRYPAYKDSGIEWIGEIPAHWELLPIRAIFSERNEKNDGIKTDFILSVTKDRGVIPYDEKGNIGNKKSDDIENYKLVYPGDFVINKMNVVIGSLGFSKYFGAFSNVYLVYRPYSDKIFLKYFSYIFSNPSFYKSLIKYCKGIMELRESLDKNLFKQILLPVPPLPEQKAIAEFLDKKTEQIDRAIAAKERLIALLKERRQILIHRAVTRGLDPNAPTKDSGIEWIGEIPAHWEMRRLKQVAVNLNHRRVPIDTNIRGRMKKKIYNYYGATGVIDKVENYIFDEPTILIAEDGANLIMRNIKLIYYPEGKYWVNNLAHILKEIKNLINRMFLGTFLESIDYSIYITGAAQPKLTKEKLMDISIIVPPLKEQEAIIKYLSLKIGRIDHAIEAQKKQIEKLKEYKDTLIDSLVKGERRVV